MPSWLTDWVGTKVRFRSKPAFLQQNWMKAPAVQKALGLLVAYSKDNKVVVKITKATEEQPGDPNADKSRRAAAG